MAQPEPWSVIAHNTATQSQNKIHDDEVARRYGFRGGLVPGVDDYAYLAHVPAAVWGRVWLDHGTLDARFLQPVYEGQHVEVRPGTPRRETTGEAFDMELLDPEGTACATATASIPAEAPSPVRRAAAPLPPLPTSPPPASPESLSVGTTFTLPTRPVTADEQATYRDDVREALALYDDEHLAHPGWLLRLANRLLAGNVALGPWIHVGSDVRHHAAVRVDDEVGGRGVVTAEWERKGHRFVTLDIELVVVDGDTETVTTTIDHTAIYRPRG